MIIALIIRHYKVYKGINYIPLSDGTKFSSILGENGAGKSSILEAFDCFFNKKPFTDWSINYEAKAEGVSGDNRPYILPFFLISKNKLRNTLNADVEQYKKAEKLSEFLWSATEKAKDTSLDEFYKQTKTLKEKINSEDYLLLAVGKRYRDNGCFFGYYHKKLSFINDEPKKGYEEDELQKYFKGFYEYIISHYSYLYIPVETDVQTYTQLETQDMQKLMDKNIQIEIENAITQKTVNQINKQLDKFVKDIEGVLEKYKYKGKFKNSLTMPDLVSKIIESYFSTKELNKKIVGSTKTIPVKELSSGEKRKALIDLAYSFLKRNTDRTSNLIIAIDEPESSLHVSSCYQQFEKLIEIAKEGHQVLITTHWYGFLPIVTKGTATSINKSIDNKITSNFFSLSNFREFIKQEKARLKKEKSREPLSIDYRIKSYNDLIQSIVISIIQEEPYNWIICEGSSEKIYFDYYFNQEIKDNKLRILPVGGYQEVMKIYNYLLGPFKDSDYDKKGKIICLIDTDASRVDVETVIKHKNLYFKRLVFNKKDDTILYDVNSDLTEETTIEDSLDSSIYIDTLKYFSIENSELESLLVDKNIKEGSVYSKSALDLRDSEKDVIKEFFNKNLGQNKLDFAEKYIEISVEKDEPKFLDWIENIKNIINN
ncbi:ATP-binding protein [Tenacibaculum finnmarkense]|uniref:AAA family ATPase n=1 Tax=Tenacibaculum finnmarkense TaxID=2781243 RepID=UPI001EFB4780|nr:AAA family ATPase [Tenacibaculum finnmarkense]MCG8883568.1 ATP-binding protein [Tenacibaculum finnmarkense]